MIGLLTKSVWILLAVPRQNLGVSLTCSEGEAVQAFFAGELDRGLGSEPCTPASPECYFPASIASAPDTEGVYMVDWDDGGTHNRKVHASHVFRDSTGEACGELEASHRSDFDDDWVAPKIPCTILARLHWEASDPEWNRLAVSSLRADFAPDEVIDGFDWHAILRFDSVDRCEAAFVTMDNLLKSCKNPERCYTHPYVNAIEYVGPSPEMRRKHLDSRKEGAKDRVKRHRVEL